MKRALLLTLIVLALPAMACSITIPMPPQINTGSTQTLALNEALPSGDTVTNVTLKMGVGELNLQGGAEGLVEGDIEYNVPEWKPSVTYADSELVIEQGQKQDGGWFPGKDTNIVNTWDLKFGAVPLALTINAGAYTGNLDLSGLHLRELTIKDGATDNRVEFTEANPESMETLVYETGASSVELKGLGYANFDTMTFRGGAGNYTLDFTGGLQQNATVNVEAGMSSLRLVIPEGTKAKVEIAGGLNSVNTQGTWTVHDDTYTTAGDSEYTLTIRVDIGMGSVTLVND